MKKRTLLALLMVLPLVGCTGNNNSNNNVVPPIVDDGGEGGEGGGQGGEGGEDHKDPVEVKQSELLDTLKTIAKNLFHEEEVEGADYWDGASKLYGVYESSMHQKTSSYKWENALDDLKGSLPTDYTVKDNRTQVKYNEIDALQENYLVSNKIEVDAWAYTFTYEEGGKSEDWVYIDFEIKAAANTTFVDDIKEDVKTATVSFTNADDFTGDFSSKNSDTFVTFFNDKAGAQDLLRSVSVEGKVEVKPNVGEDSKDCSLKLGSGSAEGSITLSFGYDITKISLSAYAYWKTYSYNGGGKNVDTSAQLFVNDNTTPYDLSCSADSIPEAQTINVEFDSPIRTLKLSSRTDVIPARVLIDSLTVTYSL